MRDLPANTRSFPDSSHIDPSEIAYLHTLMVANSITEPTMPVLSRTVRFCLSNGESPLDSPRHNTFAGWPPMLGLGASWTIIVEVEGDPDPRTGYVLGIDRIDAAIREHVIPWLLDTWQKPGANTLESLLPGIFSRVDDALEQPVKAIELQPEPMGRFRMDRSDMHHATLIRRFEFSASHRLAIPGLDDAENAKLYGKCSNPNGHGHNYEFEVAISVPQGEGNPLNMPEIDQIVDEHVVNRFDHKHLNQDLTDFQDQPASVENIATRCCEILKPLMAARGGTLKNITVWETSRTACTIDA